MRQTIALGCVVLAVAAAAQAAKPVIRLGGIDIMDVEVNLEKEIARATTPEASRNESLLLRAAVNQVLDRKLLVQAAREAKIVVTPAELQAALSTLRTTLRDPIRVAAILAEAGATEADLEKAAEESLLADKLVESTSSSKISVSEQEARSYYNAHPDEFKHPAQIKVWNIFVTVAQGASPKDEGAARATADGYMTRLRRGEAFSKVAGAAAEAGGGVRGGQIGWVRQGMLPPEMETAVWYLGEGEMTPVLRAPQGYNIFWVEKRRGPGIYPWEEISESLVTLLKGRKVQQAVGSLLDQLRKGAVVEVLDLDLQQALSAAARSGGTQAPLRP